MGFTQLINSLSAVLLLQRGATAAASRGFLNLGNVNVYLICMGVEREWQCGVVAFLSGFGNWRPFPFVFYI